MPKQSAGILLYRNEQNPEVLLVHPGGPFWKNKDEGAWSIPKGEFTEDEEPLKAAIREFEEETGKLVSGDFIELTPIKQKGGKVVHAFALEGDINTAEIQSNTFEIEWPPKSGRKQQFPEVDKVEWFDIATAKTKINSSQAILLEELRQKLLQS